MNSFFNISFADTMRGCLNKAISDAIREYREQGYSDFTRDRKLGMDKMIKFMLTMNGGSLNKELYEADIDASPSAFVQQRKKLEVSVFQSILEDYNLLCNDEKKFKGYRVFAVDGTTINLAYDENAKTYMKPTKPDRTGYNQLHCIPLYDVLNRTFQAYCMIEPQKSHDEIGALMYNLNMIEDCISEKVLIVGDRGFESYNTFAYFIENPNLDFLIRVKQGINAMKAVSQLPMKELDVDLDFTLTTSQTKADKESGCIFINTHKKQDRTYKSRARRWSYGPKYQMKFRVVRIKLSTGEFETLATSLPRDEITAEEIMELYHSRWGIENAFRELKYNLGLTLLHGKSEFFAEQEIYCAMIMSNFANRIIQNVVVNNAVNNIYEYKVNSKMAVYLCKEFFRDPWADGKELMEQIAKYTEPIRPDRMDERKIKPQSFKGFVYRVSA